MKFIAWCALLLCSLNATAQLLLEDDRVIVGNEVNVNTTELDFSPSYYRDGIVYVTTNVDDLRYKVEDERIETNIMKLWQASRSFSGVLFEPQPFYRELSSQLHEGPVTFDSTYTRIYFTRNEETGSKRRKRGRRRLKQLRIYTADLVGDEWQNERLVAFNADGANTAHPTLSPDGQLLIFSSDREGGMGGMDLWAVAKTGDDWGEPYHLGRAINTIGNDVFPFLHADGTLYYSSTTEDPDDEEGHLDIYYSRLDGANWGKGIGLGRPFNSDDDDYGLIVDETNKKGYFSSDRPGGLGGDDIYSFQVITQRVGGPLDLTIEVSDAVTGKPIDAAEITYLNTADISLARALSDGLVGGSQSDGLTLTGGQSAQTDGSGSRTLRVHSGDYLVSIRKPGYATMQLPLTLDKGDLTLPVALDPAATCNDLSIVVLDEGSLRPVPEVRVRLEGQNGGTSTDIVTNEQGEATYCVPCGDIYGISAALGGRTARPASYDTRGKACRRDGPTTMTLYLQGGRGAGDGRNPLVVGSVLQLPSVYYPFNRWELSVGARQDLNHLAALLERYPGMRIELGSHTDAQGSRAYNASLSQRRASEAKRYLVQETGIDPGRISAIGYGESRIRNRCVDGVRCTASEHRQNRRTEIKVTYVQNPVAIPASYQQAAQRGYVDSGPRSSTSSGVRQASGTATMTGDNTGRYWVVAGTFAEKSNAQRRVNELTELGYTGVEIVSFDRKASAVLARRFTSLADAAQFSRALKEAHRIPAYVRKVDANPQP